MSICEFTIYRWSELEHIRFGGDRCVSFVVSEVEEAETPDCDSGESGFKPRRSPFEDKSRGVTPVLGTGSAGFDSQVFDSFWACMYQGGDCALQARCGRFDSDRVHLLPWSKGRGCRAFNPEDAGSNPVGSMTLGV